MAKTEPVRELADPGNQLQKLEDVIADREQQIARLQRELKAAREVNQVQLQDLAAAKNGQIAECLHHLKHINASPWWRLGKGLERLGTPVGHLIAAIKPKPETMQQRQLDPLYQKWIKLYDTLSDRDRASIREHIATLDYRPLISIVMPAYDTQDERFRETIRSVQSQLYPNWELCVADDASPSPSVSATLQEFSATDKRIKWVRRATNGHISEASNSALALASGEFIALLDHDDLLPERALYEVAVELNRHLDADIIYSDEDRIGRDNLRHAPYFKPDWNPELFLGHNLISHLGVYRAALIEKIGGFRSGYEGSQDYDLALRAVNASSADRIRHIPTVLYHWRDDTNEKSFSESQFERCVDAGRRAKKDYFAARGEAAEIMPNPSMRHWDRIKRPVPTPAPLVSIVIPTRNRADLLAACVEGILHKTDYTAIEVIIIDHQSDDPRAVALLEQLKQEPRVRVLRYEGAFNYSDMNNKAVAEARGELLCLMNNDVAVIHPDWLSEMVSLAMLPDNGVVGAKLLYPNGRVQHAGVVCGVPWGMDHVQTHAPSGETGYFGRLALTTNVSAVTGACLIVRKELFDAVGGLDAIDLPIAYNDVDLCLKIRAKGYRNVWTPFATLYHHESVSRGKDCHPAKVDRANRELDFMRRKWGLELERDPYFNPNLVLRNPTVCLAFPPRRGKSWQNVGLNGKLA
jgi:GT2 family glycosyltransferase